MFYQYFDTESPGEGRGSPLHNFHPWLISSLSQGELWALGLVLQYPLHAGGRRSPQAGTTVSPRVLCKQV